MPYPFYRPDERHRRERAGNAPAPGIRVTYPDGTVHFFPGATEAQAAALVRTVCPEELLIDPRTVIEFGTKRGRAWLTEVVLKEGVNKVG